jgi:hypothetical protein
MGGSCDTHEIYKRNSYRILARKPEVKGVLENLGVDGRIKETIRRLWTRFVLLWIATTERML